MGERWQQRLAYIRPAAWRRRPGALLPEGRPRRPRGREGGNLASPALRHLVKQMAFLRVCSPVWNLTPTPKDALGVPISPVSSGFQVRTGEDGGKQQMLDLPQACKPPTQPGSPAVSSGLLDRRSAWGLPPLSPDIEPLCDALPGATATRPGCRRCRTDGLVRALAWAIGGP